MAKRTTIRDVAKAAGVSVSTASYAFRNDPRVALATREKVQKAAIALGYQLSSSVSNWMKLLRSGGDVLEKETLAFVVTEFQQRENKAVEDYFQGGRKRALEHGYKLEKLVYDDEKMSDRRLSDILKARGIRGVVVGPLREKSTYFDLDWPSFAAAGFNLFWWKPPIPRVSSDHYSTVFSAVQKAHEFGYRRVGLGIYAEVDRRYLHGLIAALTRAVDLLDGMEHLKPFVGDRDFFVDKNFADWFSEVRPDCIVGLRCLLPFLDEMGVKVPEDVAYISLNLNNATRPCAGLQIDLELMGASAVDLVVSQLNRNFFGVPEIPLTTVIGPVWSDGPTLVKRTR